MTKYPKLTGKEIGKIIIFLGFTYNHHVGSHMTFINETTGKKITIPDHGSEKIGPGLLNKIIKEDLGLTHEEFFNIIQKTKKRKRKLDVL